MQVPHHVCRLLVSTIGIITANDARTLCCASMFHERVWPWRSGQRSSPGYNSWAIVGGRDEIRGWHGSLWSQRAWQVVLRYNRDSLIRVKGGFTKHRPRSCRLHWCLELIDKLDVKWSMYKPMQRWGNSYHIIAFAAGMVLAM